MEAKHIVFFIFLFVGVPTAVIMLRSSARLQSVAFFLLIFSIPFVYSTGINFFTDEFYRGTARGFEFLATDLIGMSIIGFLISIKAASHFKWNPPGATLYFIYFTIACISTTNSESLVYSGYELLKMVMMYIFFVAVFNMSLYMRSFKIILYSLSALIILNLFWMLVQKYAFFVYQPSGIFPHRNGSAMFSNMIAPVYLSMMLNSNLTKFDFKLFSLTFGCAATTIVFALSRGAILFFPIAVSIVTLISLLRGANPRKIKIIAILSVVAVLGIIKAAPMVVERFEYAPKSSADGRIELARAALNMAQDKFWGVGINNWGIKINPPYTYWEGTGMVREEGYKSGLVETIYMMTAAECGWIGLFALLMWMGYYYYQNIRNLFRFKDSPLFFLPAGLAGGMTAVYGQSVLEWILKQPTNFYQLMIVFAIIAAMKQTYDTYRKSSKSTVRRR